MRALRGVLLVAAVVLLSGAARADDATDGKKKEAQAFFDEGIRLAKANDTKGALAAFREAYARYPSFRVLYNIGQLCSRTGDAVCAVRSYERYLHDGDKDVPAKRRKEVEAEVRQLSRTLGRIAVTSNVTGAEVLVDDEPVGRTPFSDAVAVSGGAHKVVGIGPDDARAEKTVTVVAGQNVAVDLEIEKKDKPAAAAPPEPVAEKAAEPAPPPKEPSAPFPIVPWAVTGGLAAVTAVSAVLAAGAYSDWKATRDTFPITRDQLDSAHGKARDLFLVSGAFGVATLVSAGVATYFTLGGKPPDTSKEKKSVRRGLHHVALVPLVGGLAVTGGFP